MHKFDAQSRPYSLEINTRCTSYDCRPWQTVTLSSWERLNMTSIWGQPTRKTANKKCSDVWRQQEAKLTRTCESTAITFQTKLTNFFEQSRLINKDEQTNIELLTLWKCGVIHGDSEYRGQPVAPSGTKRYCWLLKGNDTCSTLDI